MSNSLITYWKNYSPREQRLLAGCSLLLLIVLIWYGMVSPVLGYRDSQRLRVDKIESDLHWMSQQQDLLVRLRAYQADETLVKKSLSSAVKESAQQSEIILSNIRADEKQVEVQIQALPFNRLLSWLQVLESNYAIQAKNLSLQSNPSHNGEAQAVILFLSRRQH